MFFTASKLVWIVAAPTNALLLLLAAAPLLRWMDFRWLSRTAAAVATVSLLVIAFSPVGNLLLRPLEDRFPQPSADMAPPTGIIVLGGSTDEMVSAARNQVTVSQAATRVTEAVVLSRRYPTARLVFSGGSGALLTPTRTEASDTRDLWIALGVPPERISVEDRSRNTYENAQFTKRLIEPKSGERWLLVTSAYHMPRAVAVFRTAGMDVIPFPVDYMTTGTDYDWLPRNQAVEALTRFDLALREWVGLVAYEATGRTDTLFPDSTTGSR